MHGHHCSIGHEAVASSQNGYDTNLPLCVAVSNEQYGHMINTTIITSKHSSSSFLITARHPMAPNWVLPYMTVLPVCMPNVGVGTPKKGRGHHLRSSVTTLRQ